MDIKLYLLIKNSQMILIVKLKKTIKIRWNQWFYSSDIPKL